jgi:hypothetical protein
VVAVTEDNAWSLELTLGLEGLAWVSVERGELERAARLLGAADRIRGVGGIPVQDSERVARDRVRAALDNHERPFDDAHAEGYSFDESAAAAYALSQHGHSSPDEAARHGVS